MSKAHRFLIEIDEAAALEIYAISGLIQDMTPFCSDHVHDITDMLLLALLEWWFLCEPAGLDKIIKACVKSVDDHHQCHGLIAHLREMASPQRKLYPKLHDSIELVKDELEDRFSMRRFEITDPEMNHAAQLMVFWLHYD